jgi:UDP-N-acetylglucosamine acyltransferase
MSKIHPTAIVHPDAVLGEDVEIGAYAIVEANTRIGDRCRILTHAIIAAGTTMGEDNVIGHHAVIGGAPQVLAYDGQPSELVIGNRNVIREFSNINRSTESKVPTRIGNECYLMAHAHIGHHCQLSDRVVVCNNSLLAGHVEAGPRAFISGNVVVHQFSRIGRLAMIGGLSAINQDVPPFSMAVGSRPCQLFGLNLVGLRRAGIEPLDRRALQDTFHQIFRHEGSFQEALLTEFRMDHALVRELVEFCRTSKRGVLKAARRSRSSDGEEGSGDGSNGDAPARDEAEIVPQPPQGLSSGRHIADRYFTSEDILHLEGRRQKT